MVYQVSGARLVKLHFSQFDLPPGVSVEISNPDGSESWRYSSTDRDPLTLDEDMGDNGANSFWAMSISGDTALVRLSGNLYRFDPSQHGIEIDTYIQNFEHVDRAILEGAEEGLLKSTPKKGPTKLLAQPSLPKTPAT